MRVVAGRLRSRRLRTGRGDGTRPTTDRARAGLFDWLGSQVADALVLDLFAGCGALAIEALSRGARAAVLVERARAPLQVLRTNLASLELRGVTRVIGRDAGRALPLLVAEGHAFDLVLADPPYASDWLGRLAQSRHLVDLLAEGGILVMERSSHTAPPLENALLELRETRRYGETCFDWYEKDGETGA